MRLFALHALQGQQKHAAPAILARIGSGDVGADGFVEVVGTAARLAELAHFQTSGHVDFNGVFLHAVAAGLVVRHQVFYWLGMHAAQFVQQQTDLLCTLVGLLPGQLLNETDVVGPPGQLVAQTCQLGLQPGFLLHKLVFRHLVVLFLPGTLPNLLLVGLVAFAPDRFRRFGWCGWCGRCDLFG